MKIKHISGNEPEYFNNFGDDRPFVGYQKVDARATEGLGTGGMVSPKAKTVKQIISGVVRKAAGLRKRGYDFAGDLEVTVTFRKNANCAKTMEEFDVKYLVTDW